MHALSRAVLIVGLGTFSLCASAAEPAVKAAASAARTTATSPKVEVHKSPSCGCCGAWVEHMREHGFETATHNVDNLDGIKKRVGVPYGLGSCHTAEVGGYFIEGHVPAAEVKRLLTEKPKAKGLTVPRMPIGSPGMESGDRVDPYEVLLVHEDGTTSVYAKYPKN